MTTLKGTYYTTPKTNIFSAVKALYKIRNYYSESKVHLVKGFNEECEHPIKEKLVKDKSNRDPQRWVSTGSLMFTYKDIIESGRGDDQIYMMLNYHAQFGDAKEVEKYYKTGIVTKKQVSGVGKCHLVKNEHMAKFLREDGQIERAESFEKKGTEHETKEWYSTVHNLNNNYTTRLNKKFKRKLWVVQNVPPSETPNKKLHWLMWFAKRYYHTIRWIPKRSVLRMPKYRTITYRIGDISNGFEISLQIPKKFSFKD